MLPLGLLLSAAIGVALGMLGGGGSMLTVPTLHYVFGLSTHDAIAASLAVVAITGLAALVPHARAGRVHGRIGLLFGAASMIGAYAAARIARYLPGELLLVLLGAVMLATAAAMLRGRRPAVPPRSAPVRATGVPAARIVAQGLFVGALSGLVGAGGGFLIVPALVMLAGLAICEAVATSLLVIVLNATAGFAGACSSAEIHGQVIAIVSGIAVLGSIAGASLAPRIAPARLRTLFGWFVIVMAVVMLGQELPRALGHPVDLSHDWPWLLGGALIALLVVISIVVGIALWSASRHTREPPRRGAPSQGGSRDAVSSAVRS